MIISKDNKFISHINKLNASKKYRHSHNQTVLETEHSILDTLQHFPSQISYIVTTSQHKTLINKAEALNIKTYLCDETVINYCAYVKHSQGCLAVIDMPQWSLENTDYNFVLALFNINNPSNLGSILRNAHAFGCDAIFKIGHSCDSLHPDCIRASSGNVFSVPIHCLQEEQSMHILKKFTCWILDIKAKTTLAEIPSTEKMCFIFGSETGLKTPLHTITNRCKIPIKSTVDSLNVAATSAIVLHQFLK